MPNQLNEDEVFAICSRVKANVVGNEPIPVVAENPFRRKFLPGSFGPRDYLECSLVEAGLLGIGCRTSELPWDGLPVR